MIYQYLEDPGFEGFNYNKYKANSNMFLCEFIVFMRILFLKYISFILVLKYFIMLKIL